MNKINKLIKKLFLCSWENKGSIPKSFMKTFLPDNPIIIEAGAHIGIDTCEMAKLWPKSKIFAFEPIPEIYSQLIKKTQSFENVRCFKQALSEKTGVVTMNVSKGVSDGSSSILEPKEHLVLHPDVLFEKKIDVDAITLNDWMKKNEIKHIDLLWLDLQGFEFNVLKASSEILKNVTMIYTEVSIEELYSGSMLYPEFRNWIESFGFEVMREELVWQDAGNVLFKKKIDFIE